MIMIMMMLIIIMITIIIMMMIIVSDHRLEQLAGAPPLQVTSRAALPRWRLGRSWLAAAGGGGAMAESAQPTWAERYKTMKVSLSPDGVCVATMCSQDEVGLNLLTGRLFREFADTVDKAARSDDVRVLVMRSADEDFWLAHFDINAILKVVNSYNAVIHRHTL